MSAFRKHLSAWSIGWLLCQAVSITVLLPSGWTSPAVSTKECLATTPAEECPMHDANGAPCPMHQGTTTESGTRECAIRGLSDSPAAAIAGLFSIPGILLDESDIRIEPRSSLLTMVADRTPDAPASLDTPPPKS